MKINKEILYHIKRSDFKVEGWGNNNIIDWTNRKNRFIKGLFSVDLEMEFQDEKMTCKEVNKILLGMSEEERNKHLFYAYDFSSFALNRTSMILRELIFEEYRKNNCPHLPSRYNSIWLCNEQNLNYWIKALQVKTHRVFKVEASGNAHISSDSCLGADVKNVVQFEALAKEYWKEGQTVGADTEIIFQGTIKVLEELII